MSVRVLNEVFRYSESKLGARLVLLVLADAAHDDGICWPTQARIAAKAGIVDSSVRRTLAALEEAGEIEIKTVRRGRSTINVYRVLVGDIAEPDPARMPSEIGALFPQPPNIGGSEEAFTRRSTDVSPAEDRRSRAGDPLSSNRKETRKDPPVSPPVPVVIDLGSDDAAVLAAAVPKEVDRRDVTYADRLLAGQILAAWNTETGQSKRAPDFLRKIVMRIREHPELALEAHEAIIRTALNDPWWRGLPSPPVVYGNSGIFEKCLDEARAVFEQSDGADYDPWASRRRETV